MDTARTHTRTERNKLPVFFYIMNIYGYSLYIPYMFHIYFLSRFHIGGRGEGPYREIVSFRSCVRTRGVHCLVGTSPKGHADLFPFPFLRGRLSLFPWDRKWNQSELFAKSNVNSKWIQSESNVKSSPLPPILLSSFGWLYRYFMLRKDFLMISMTLHDLCWVNSEGILTIQK